ncbi:MAG: PKD domain-containing protein [Calditrichaceae bacterium]|nr:PKD domain-containing protein [Calditrichaceae bacterium]
MNYVKQIFIVFLSCFCLSGIAKGQELTAIIIVDDAQWFTNSGDSIDLDERFPGASLTRWYAPLPVFFQGWKSSPRDAIVDYQWDFGDGSPVFHGFNAGHVYETAGNYIVTLTVIDTLNQSDTETINIEVLEREGKIYYVDSDLGDDSYDGLSQTHTSGTNGPWKTADKAFSEMASDLYEPGDQILFNRGQTFDLTVSEIIPGAWPAWGYMFGAYGNGSRPIIQYRGENNTIIIHQYSIGLAHVSFVDLDLRMDDYTGHRAGVFFFAQGGGTRNILFLRVSALDAYSDLFTVGIYLESEISTGTFAVNCSITNTYIDPENNSTLFAVWGSRVALLNNYFDLSGNHIGYTAINKGVIAGNTYSRPAFGRTALRICGFSEEGDDWNTELTSNNVQISDNYFHGWIDPETEGRAHNGGGTRFNYLLVQLAPNGPWNQIIEDITFERNIITNGEGLMSIGAAENITVRNNILISDNAGKPSYFIDIVNANKPSKNIIIIGNTFVSRNAQYSGNIYEMSGLIRIENNATQVAHPFNYTNHEDIYIRNNIFYSYGTNNFTRFLYIDNIDEVLPQVESDHNLFFVSEGSDDGAFFQIGDAPGGTAQYLTLEQWQNQQEQDNFSIFGDPQFIDLLGADSALSAYGYDADLKIMAGSPARNIGCLDRQNAYFDFNKYKRYGSDQSVDAGAYEYGSTTGIAVKPENGVPVNLFLSQNYPNPFNPITNIEYQISNAEFVTLKIFDILGREVVTLVNENKPAGTYTVQWNGRNMQGQQVGSGIYYYQMQTGDGHVSVKKMLLLK